MIVSHLFIDYVCYLLLPMMISAEVKCAVIVYNKLLYIYGLYGLNHHTVEMSPRRDDDDKQRKIELLSKPESRNLLENIGTFLASKMEKERRSTFLLLKSNPAWTNNLIPFCKMHSNKCNSVCIILFTCECVSFLHKFCFS